MLSFLRLTRARKGSWLKKLPLSVDFLSFRLGRSLFRYRLYENIAAFSGCSPFSVHFNVSLVFQPSFCSEKFISTIIFYYNDYFEDISPLSALCLYTHDVVDDDEGTARESAQRYTKHCIVLWQIKCSATLLRRYFCVYVHCSPEIPRFKRCVVCSA